MVNVRRDTIARRGLHPQHKTHVRPVITVRRARAVRPHAGPVSIQGPKRHPVQTSVPVAMVPVHHRPVQILVRREHIQPVGRPAVQVAQVEHMVQQPD